jgi:hypothetical protein
MDLTSKTFMKNLIFLLITCLPLVINAQSIIQAEYFIGSDPGVGKAISLPVSTGSEIDENFEVDLPEIQPGHHLLCVRVKGSDGRWSIYSRRMILVSGVSNIVSAEYYIDEDPGNGMGTSMLVIAGKTINEQNYEVDLENKILSHNER